ncbi:ABC transporter ATP-binding protein [Euzebya sp.]|uniref:ABC transporter ATP-binding protein n=1 Tax=Euzebya sp. TaxID=1971409 RepID=UPI003513F444
MAELTCRDVTVRYGGVHAVTVDRLDVPDATCVAVVGPNGAGKTSLLRGLSGLEAVDRGAAITLDGTPLHDLPAETRVRAGLGHVLENRHVFPRLSVRENLTLAHVATAGRRGGDADLRRALDVFGELEEMFDTPASALSGGQQQFLAFARALMARPRVLLLDEPTVGLAPRLVARISEGIEQVLAAGTAVLLVEQRLEVVQRVASVAHILVSGTVAETADPTAADFGDIVHRRYLGQTT